MKNNFTLFRRMHILIAILLLFTSARGTLENGESNSNDEVIVYIIPIKQQIDPRTVRITQRGFEEAMAMNASYIIIHMNTYGGLVDAADSIRTRILNSKIPVYVFIDNNAASAGALISIACDSIYMRPGGNIGAATVVNQTGEAAPDKYQSYMRSTMRATAEAQGKDTVIRGNDTIIEWRRDPAIAEAMVDPSTYIEGVIDTGKVLTLTAEEALDIGYADAIAENMEEVLAQAGIENYKKVEYKISSLEKIILFFLNPVIQGVLIMLIVGGIYFELQTPGIGFPIAAAGVAAILYFLPLYLEGIAENWEILLFIGGLILLALEIFVIPGFGIAGFGGVALLVTGLTLAMIDNIVFEMEDFSIGITAIIRALFIVLSSLFTSIVLSIYLSKFFFASSFFHGLALDTVQNQAEGYVGVDPLFKSMVGKAGIARTVLRPSGSIIIDDEIYDAKSLTGYIEKNTPVKVVKYETGQLYVVKKEDA